MRKAARKHRLTVCLLSSHPLVLEELQGLLSGSGFRIQVRRLDSASVPGLRRLPLPRAEVYVVDALASRQGTEALVAGILERFPGCKLLVLDERFDEANAFPLLALGAKGLLNYKEVAQQLSRAVPQIAAGGFWVPRSVLSRFVDSTLSRRGRRFMTTPASLSRREREVLDALLANLSNKEIATKLYISERTVKFHVSHLLAKFGARRRGDLILMCYQHKPVDT